MICFEPTTEQEKELKHWADRLATQLEFVTRRIYAHNDSIDSRCETGECRVCFKREHSQKLAADYFAKYPQQDGAQ